MEFAIIKDLSDVVGIKTTYGYPGTKDYFPKKIHYL